jgi:hypothetical protein
MSSHRPVPHGGFDRDSMPLDTARTALEWLVTGPHPVAVDGRLFPGLPPHRIPLNELRERLLARHCPQAVRDAVWTHLVLLSRTEGATWTVGCVGVALPALTTIAATLSARFAGDPSDIHAAVLTGFLAELARIDTRKPRVMLRLRWAAYRAGHVAVREALDTPAPSGHGFHSSEPAPPWGHPDLVLARAVAEGVITGGEAELIGATRLEGVALAEVAQRRDSTYKAVQMARSRAERRLLAYLTDTGPDGMNRSEDEVADHALDAVTLARAEQSTGRDTVIYHGHRDRAATTAPGGELRPRHSARSRTVSARRVKSGKNAGPHVWETAPESGVQVRGRTSAPSAHPVPSTRPRSTRPSDAGPNSEAPRCA